MRPGREAVPGRQAVAAVGEAPLPVLDSVLTLALRSWEFERGMWQPMRGLLSRFSDWVVRHPVVWGVGSGAALVLLGFALQLSPIVVVGAGAAIGVLNIVHARRRGYCPLPAEPNSQPGGAEPE